MNSNSCTQWQWPYKVGSSWQSATNGEKATESYRFLMTYWQLRDSWKWGGLSILLWTLWWVQQALMDRSKLVVTKLLYLSSMRNKTNKKYAMWVLKYNFLIVRWYIIKYLGIRSYNTCNIATYFTMAQKKISKNKEKRKEKGPGL